MKATELRIGNFIEHNATATGDWVEMSIQPIDIPIVSTNKESFRGIPLTSQWLRKFKFKLFYEDLAGEIGWEFRKGKLTVIKYSDKKNSISIFFGQEELRTIRYVHQLQNLYHALTGEELTLTKPKQ